jgi:hypothetical protein
MCKYSYLKSFIKKIIIVGVGDSDFSKMGVLDADVVPLRSSEGQQMARDIVQFGTI